MDRDRFGADSPDDAPADAAVCAVATQADTFQRCRRGFYPAPQSYQRTQEPFEYMAFYRTAPVSAITHYAPVENRVEQRRGGPGPMTEADWAATIDPFSDGETVVVFELGALIPLDSPVQNDQTGLRGAWYCTVGDLRASATLSDLAARAGN